MARTDQNLEEPGQNLSPVVEAQEAIETELLEGVDAKLEEKEKREKSSVELGMLNLNVQLPLKEQKEAMSNLEAVIDELILLTLKAGEKKEDLLKSPLTLKRYAKSPAQILAVEKFGQLLVSQAEDALAWWRENLEEGSEHFKDAAGEKEKTEKGETSEKTEWMSPTVKWSLVAAGAVGGAYLLYKYFNAKDEEKKGKDLAIGGALAAMGVGVLVGSETLGKWSADYLNLDVSSDAIKDLMSGKGLSSLLFSSREPGIKKAAKELNITERTLIDLKDVKWGDFSSFRADAARTGRSYAQGLLESVGMGDMPGVSLDEDGEQAREEVKLEYFIKRHEDKIEGNIETMTISEILNELESKGVFGTSDERKEDEAAKEGEGLPETNEDLSSFPHVSAALEGMRSGELSWDEGLTEIMLGAKEDGGGIGILDGAAVLLKGAFCIPLSSADIVVSQIKDLGEAISGTGSWSEVPFEGQQVYWFGTYAAFHMAKVAVSNFKAGTFKPMDIAVGGIKGGFRGILDSYILIPKWGVKIAHGVKSGSLSTKDAGYQFLARETLTTLSPQERIHLLHERANYLGKQYKHYYEKVDNLETEGTIGKTKKWLYEKLFGTEWLTEMRRKAGLRFLEARKDFFKALGEADTMTGVNKTGITNADDAIMETLARGVDDFAGDSLKARLPKIPEYRVLDPKYASHAKATEAKVGKLDFGPSHMSRMEALGLDHDRIGLRLRDYGFKRDDLEKLLTELEATKNPTQSAKDLEVLLWKIKNPKKFLWGTRIAKGLGVLGTLYMLYDFQESKDKWNTAGESGSMAVSFALGAKAGTMAVPHPIGKAVAGVVGGLAAAFGGHKAWNSLGRPYLQKYCPNRQEFFDNPAVAATGNYLSLATGGLFMNSALYAADAMGVSVDFLDFGDRVDEETDPLHYLEESKYTWHPDFAKEILAGERWWPYGDHRMHDLNDLQTNAQEAYSSTEEEIKDLDSEVIEKQKDLAETTDLGRKETLEIEIEEAAKKREDLERLLLIYQSYTDGSWVEVKKMELIFVQTEMIEPAFEKFQRLSEAKFGADGLEAFNRLMQRIQQGREGVKGDKEMEVWQYLCDESIQTEGGEAVPFADFVSLAIVTYHDAEFLDSVEKDLALQNPEPVASGEGAVEGESEAA